MSTVESISPLSRQPLHRSVLSNFDCVLYLFYVDYVFMSRICFLKKLPPSGTFKYSYSISVLVTFHLLMYLTFNSPRFISMLQREQDLFFLYILGAVISCYTPSLRRTYQKRHTHCVRRNVLINSLLTPHSSYVL